MVRRYYVVIAVLLTAGLMIAGCGGGGGGGGGGISVSLSPNSATIRPSTSLNLMATVAGTTNTAVSWTYSGGSVMVVPGTNTGTFVAPAASGGTYTVRAISQADPTKSATAQINVSNEVSNVTVSIAPDDPELSPGQFVDLTATVTGATNTAVTWSASGGTLVPSGNTARFTAPITEGTYTVQAISVADTTKSDSTLILVTRESPPPPPPL